MRFALLFLFIIGSEVYGQVTVNGVVPGDLWRTENVSGEVECMHGWGRTTIVKVKDAWVNIEDKDIRIGFRFDDPLLDGEHRKGYFFPAMQGKLDVGWEKDVQAIVSKEITTAEYGEFRTIRTAMIAMKEGKPESLTFTQTEFAMFDVRKAKSDLRKKGGALSERDLDYLAGFNEIGFRTKTAYAVFGKFIEVTENETTYDGYGKRPSTMPPKRADGREFDGGPDFGNGSWAQRDEDGVWRRNGG